jgi:hypothetical protein
MTYPIIHIKNYDEIEQIGTKEKFWFYDEQDRVRQLFKIGRSGTGENWSEKVTSELAHLLNIPCATYDFAIWNDKEGVVSPSFVPQQGWLVHGNEILAKIIENYPSYQLYKVREYKLNTVLDIMNMLNIKLPIGYNQNANIQNISDLFMGYLMFDCWISNPDRHHENWGFIFDVINNSFHLAPTYDHASGLGCRISDKERNERLKTKDKGYSVAAFVKRAKSAFFDDTKLKQLKTIDAFLVAAKHNPKAALFWLNELENLSQDQIENIFAEVPEHLISNAAINFALAILDENKIRLVNTTKGLVND